MADNPHYSRDSTPHSLILLVETSDNLHQGRLTRTIQTDDTYLRTIKETKIDVLEHLFLILLDGLAHPDHREYHFLIVYCCHNIKLSTLNPQL